MAILNSQYNDLESLRVVSSIEILIKYLIVLKTISYNFIM